MVKRVVVTGGAGQIAYSLLFRIASGELLGKEEPIALRIVEIPEVVPALEGVAMELEDCAFPLLHDIQVGSDPKKLFQDADYVFLVGSKPRGPGMERGELLAENGKIFVEQGRALNESAKDSALILVVGNPCNTNCLIAMHHAPRIPRRQFHAMTRLDQNRAVAQLAKKANKPASAVSNAVIWGNHSSTQVPDYIHATIDGVKAESAIQDKEWLEGQLIPIVQKRGAEVIAARGKSSAASAANAALDAMRALIEKTPPGKWFSSGVDSRGNPYGIADDLIFSFPCRSEGNGKWEFVPGLEPDASLREKIKASEKELLEERALVKDLLKG